MSASSTTSSIRLGVIDAPIAVARASRHRARRDHAGADLAGLSVLRRHDPRRPADVPRELYEAAEIDGATRVPDAFCTSRCPRIADVMATALLLRTIWVANSLDVILVMTGGGPGYATHTLPLYAFLRAYSGMEFGYARGARADPDLPAAGRRLALCAARIAGSSSDDRPPVRDAAVPRGRGAGAARSSRSLSRPIVWMVLTSIKPQAELSRLAGALSAASSATLEHYRELMRPHKLRRQPPATASSSPAAPRLLGPGVSACRPPTRSRASGFAGRRLLMTAFLVINMFPIVLLIIPLFMLMRNAGPHRHLPRRHPRPLDLRDPVRDLDADELLQCHPARPRRGGDDRRRDAGCRRSAS